MKNKYKISKYGKPELVEIEGETEFYVRQVGHRSMDKKETDYQKFVDTLDEAKTWRISLVLTEISKYEQYLSDAKEKHMRLLKEIETWA